jgi:outer membrane protein
MMKRLLVAASLLMALIWSVGAMAQSIGVVNMRQIFDSSPQIKKINEQLNKQYSPERDKIVAMGKSLQDNINKLQKNQAVMDKKSLDSLRDTIAKQEQDLRMQQAQFQQTLFAAQNKAMNDFMDKITVAVKQIAADKKLDLVLPQNSLLYAKDSMDITADVTNALK